MIEISEKEFEKISGPIATMVRRLFDSSNASYAEEVLAERVKTKAKEKAIQSVGNDKENPRPYNEIRIKKLKNSMSKTSSLNDRPKVDKTAIRKAKDTSLNENDNHSLRRAIERSTNQKNTLTKVRNSSEPMYSGGNTASNLRGVARSQEKNFREDLNGRLGKNSRTSLI